MGERAEGRGGRQRGGRERAQHPSVHPSEWPVLRGTGGGAAREVGPWARPPDQQRSQTWKPTALDFLELKGLDPGGALAQLELHPPPPHTHALENT